MRACVGMTVMLLIVAMCAGPVAAATEPSESRVEVAEPVPIEVREVDVMPIGVGEADVRELLPVKVGVGAPLEIVPPQFFLGRRSGLERGASRPLVVRSTQKELDVAAVVEDMSVMSGIFEKTLQDKFGEDFASSRLIIGGGSVWALSGFRGIQGIYLEGHGLLFMMRVKFPLLPPLEVEAPKVEEGADSVWEQTKREVLGTGKALATERQAYDADKVAILKKILLEALKHASNIRNLHPEESIAVVLLGGGVPDHRSRALRPSNGDGTFSDVTVEAGVDVRGGMRTETYSATKGVRVERRRRGTRTYIADDSPPGTLLTGPSQATVLTVHVRKSDVDAFAQGKLTLDEFRKRATITAY